MPLTMIALVPFILAQTQNIYANALMVAVLTGIVLFAVCRTSNRS